MLLDLESLLIKHDLKINGVIHIGAHYGEENRIYEKLKLQNRMFFEPLKKNFEVLKSNISNFPIFNLALGNETGQIKMFTESRNNGQSSSILKPKIHLNQYPHIVFDGEEVVEIIKLDDFDYDKEKFNFINIDVQGYELEVFKGAKKVLESIDYILSEVNNAEVYENCVNVSELDVFLSKFGFERVETNWEGGTWGDAFYIKR